MVTRPINEDGTVAELIGEQIIGNRILVIGDSIMASTATRYTGYMCDELVPLGWSVAVEAEPSRFIDFGNRVLDRRLDPDRGEDFDWDAAVVHLGSNYGDDQERFEAELRLILTRLAPRPTLLFTVTEYEPSYAQANESIRKLAAEFDNVTLLDWEQVSKYPGVLSSDRLHPTDDGRHVLVDMVAEALGPATLGEGECLKSQLTDDSAARGGGSGPASNPSAGSGTTATTVRPTTPTDDALDHGLRRRWDVRRLDDRSGDHAGTEHDDGHHGGAHHRCSHDRSSDDRRAHHRRCDDGSARRPPPRRRWRRQASGG